MKSRKWRFGVVAVVSVMAAVVVAEPIPRDKVPEELRSWTDWVLHGHEEALCSFLQGAGERRQCLWPSRLALALESRGGRFTQDWLAQRDAWVPLPGDEKRWPVDVRVDGKPATVTLHDGAPSVRLAKGSHAVSGGFAWDNLPELLPIPPETGLVALTLNGKVVPFPNRDPQGQLWLQKRAVESTEESRLDVVVYRKVIDEIPLQLVTRIELRVSGASRELLLGKALPDPFVPMSLASPLPSRLETDGRLRIQVRPGTWFLEITARHDGPAKELGLAAVEGPWDAEEVWVFEARNQLRLVSVEGVPAVDPQQTELPGDWRQLPAYRMIPGATMKLVEKRRGDSDPAPDQLSLQRTWWLDFNGGGLTIKDQLGGTMSQSWRLEMAPPTVLGRASIDGRDQFLTRLGDRPSSGFEIRQGQLRVEADSRFEGRVSTVPAVGWDHDFQEVSGQLNLPPGWRLFHAWGVDDVSSSWITDWTLLDLFVVLITAMAVARLWSPAWGLLALFALGLSYHESSAPGWAWLAALPTHALVRALPQGRPLEWAKAAQLVSIVALVLISFAFAVDQVRFGIYPQLERPWIVAGAPPQAVGGEVMGRAAPGGAPKALSMPMRAADEATQMAEDVRERAGSRLDRMVASKAPAQEPYYRLDPNALIPTGPGLPRWSWNTVSLRWRGPVERDQQLRLLLISPRTNLLASFVRVALVGLLLLCVVRSAVKMRAPSGGARATAGFIIFLLIGPGLGRARADFPSPELLNELRDRLLEKLECLPICAASPRLRLEITRAGMVARMEVDAAAETAVPLPGGARHWSPEKILVDGQPAAGLVRTSDGILWAALPVGTHQILLEGPLPEVDTLELPLPMKPHRIEARTEGWTVEGIHEDGMADDNLELARVREKTDAARESLQPGTLPPFVRVERVLRLGLSLDADTRIVRLTPPGSAVVLEVPLVAGESVTTPDVRVKNGKALVSLGPQMTEVGWHSLLEEASSIGLHAPEGAAWTEIWRVDASPVWHLDVAGIPVVHQPTPTSVRTREWHPWPGESVTLTLTRPAAAAGQTLTVDSAILEMKPGLRASDTTLSVEMRSSRGGQHRLTLPEDAELQSVTINGTTQPIRQEKQLVTIPLVPGSQNVSLAWREKRGITTRLASPELGLGTPSVNAETRIAMPVDRWTLFVGGGALGPAVLFWALLVVVALAALALGRVDLAPLGPRDWFLLGIGLTQAPLYVSAIVVGWLLALGWRKGQGAAMSDLRFDLLQIVLVVWTVFALEGLFAAIEQGLLGLPEMQILGNGSTVSLLRWYHDRSSETLPRTWVLSVPLMVYRLAMLAWALWIAWALLGWLRWGWGCFNEGGLWRRRVRAKAKT